MSACDDTFAMNMEAQVDQVRHQQSETTAKCFHTKKEAAVEQAASASTFFRHIDHASQREWARP
jgi:hypothetical protein